MIHNNYISEIASVIENSKTENIARNFQEIYSKPVTREAYPGLTEKFMISFPGLLLHLITVNMMDNRGYTLTVIDLQTSEIDREIDLGEYTRPYGLAWLDDG